MDVNTDDLSAFLNLAWQNATDAANTLPAQLLAEQQKALSLLAQGSVASVAKNSTSQTYGYYGPGTLTHRQITNVFTTLIRYYEAAKQKIVDAAAKASPVVSLDGFDFDPSVYALLTDMLQLSTQAARLPDITNMRIPLDRATGGWGVGECA